MASRWFKATCIDWEKVYRSLPRPLSREALRLDYLSLKSQGYELSQRELAERWGCSRGRVTRFLKAMDPDPIQNEAKKKPSNPLRKPNIKNYPIHSESKTNPKPIHHQPKSPLEGPSFASLRKEKKRIGSHSEQGFQSSGTAQVLSFRERLLRRGNG